MQLRHKYNKAEEDEHLEIIQRKRKRGKYIVKEEEEEKEVEEEKHDEQDDELPGPSKSHNRTNTQNKENGESLELRAELSIAVKEQCLKNNSNNNHT